MGEPKLRFKADDGSDFPNWEKSTVGELFVSVTTKNRGGRITNVITNSAEYGLIPQRDYFDKDIAVEGNTDNYTVIHKGDFVYNPRKSAIAPFGPFNIYEREEDGIVSPLYTCMAPRKAEAAPYLSWYFQTSRWHPYIVTHGAQGGARHDRVGMTAALMAGIPVTLPSLSEQRKIADFLSAVDAVIAVQQAEVNAWEQRKKGVMQKLFSQEVRFKADDGSEFPEWEEKTLGDLGRFYSGTGFSEKYQGYLDKPVDAYKVSDMNRPENRKEMIIANNTVDDDILKAMKSKAITVPCIIFAKVGAAIYAERKRMARKPFIVDNNMMAFAPNEDNDFKFIYWLTETLVFSRYAQVGALPSYNASDIGFIRVKLPIHIDEQRKIADCLASMDEVIQKAKDELAKWQELKKGLLQQMFV